MADQPAAGAALTRVDTLERIEDFRTWSALDGRCSYSLTTPEEGQAPQEYDAAVIEPQRRERRARYGYPSHFEHDVDCLAAAFGEPTLFEFAQGGDPLAQFHQVLKGFGAGCEATPGADADLVAAFEALKAPADAGGFGEALYAAAAWRSKCAGDREGALALLRRSASAGYSWAEQPRY